MVEKTGYSRCLDCGLVRIHASTTHDLDDYTRQYRSLFGSDLEVRINVNRVATVMKFVETGKRVLDFGCSCGSFLARLEQYGYKCEGYEPSKIAPDNKTCVAPIHTNTEDIEGKFDCITLFDVFEHLENPVEATHLLRSLLAPGGHLIIITPNPECREDLENFYHLKPSEHAYLWSLGSLTKFMRGYELMYEYDDFSEGQIRRNAGSSDTLLAVVFIAS